MQGWGHWHIPTQWMGQARSLNGNTACIISQELCKNVSTSNRWRLCGGTSMACGSHWGEGAVLREQHPGMQFGCGIPQQLSAMAHHMVNTVRPEVKLSLPKSSVLQSEERRRLTRKTASWPWRTGWMRNGSGSVGGVQKWTHNAGQDGWSPVKMLHVPKAGKEEPCQPLQSINLR